jgi:NADH-quinone oxidoreductase subunit M
MAGPTPVSALIHAATMVTAGVYLIARTHALFALAPAVQSAVAVIGALTLLLAGCSALTQRDIKRVLAYSTISQIGYMFLALEVGAWSAAIFHLLTHAFFKALLFLAAGSVILSLHQEHDIFRSIWGHENRVYAAIKFFIFTQASSLLMLLAILTLFFLHHQQTGVYTFAYDQLLGTLMDPSTAMWLMLGFFVAFAVKLPAVPFHTWLPDAHTEAPTAGSVILAGLLLKTGAYGMLRFVLPLFPQAAWLFAPAAMVLAVTGILYGAVLAFAQADLKRLVAYTSISHLGFVLLGIFAWNELALQGAVLQMICHGISTGALFMLAGALQARLHTRDMRRMGGLWSTAPRLGGVGLFFAMAALGLPGLGNFLAEFLVLVGSFRVSALLTMVATLGLVTATVYALRLVQQTFHGPNTEGWRIPDLTARNMATMAVMIAALVWLGLYPPSVPEDRSAGFE